jgi:hypothetical protein
MKVMALIWEEFYDHLNQHTATGNTSEQCRGNMKKLLLKLIVIFQYFHLVPILCPEFLKKNEILFNFICFTLQLTAPTMLKL